jgi:hypothetical protein
VSAEQVFIEFDGRQLAITSDDPEAIDYFRRSYTQMLVPGATNSMGTLSVMRTTDGYYVEGAQEMDHKGSLESLFDWLRRDVFLSFVRSRPDLLWLHAGAVEKNEGAIIISGTSGRGKSTLVTRLIERGWKLLSDESAPIRLDVNEVIPFPQTPRRRIFPGRALSQEELGTFKFEEISIPSGVIRRTPVAIRAMVFPQFEMEATPQLERLTPGEAALEMIRNSTNFVDHKAAAVERVAGIATEIPCYRLVYGNGVDAANVLDDLGLRSGADRLQ